MIYAYEGEAIPPILWGGGDKFVLHPKNTQLLKKGAESLHNSSLQ